MNPSPQAEKPTPSAEDSAVAGFIARWKRKDGGEPSNYQLFIELCDIPSSRPARSDSMKKALPLQENDFVNSPLTLD